jgi:hypothetical protein
MAGPLVANPNPFSFDETPFGKVYLTGAISGLGLFQTNSLPGDHNARGDISNGHAILQTTEGFVQFYAQAGIYSFPTLGAPYVSAQRTTGDTFSPLPVAYVKLAPNDAFNVQVGKLPTLIGAEYGFTFQNMNIERGLLWAQEPIVSRGIQANYASDPLTLAVSLNDGFYSDSYNWLVGSLAYAINKQNTFTIVGGGNFDQTAKNVVSCRAFDCIAKTPIFQNNGQILNVIYSYSNAPWTITPYFQYTHVPSNAFLGVPRDGSTYGGAVLASYAVSDNLSLAGRIEGIGSTGSLANGAPNLLGYGPGSAAWSVTVTPTYQAGVWFARADASWTQASSIAPGFGFGKTGGSRNQGRIVLEAGVIF